MEHKVRRKKAHEEPENHERWLVSYADFITLMFAFFVVLYATSTQNADKEKKFEKSIREEMKMPGEPSGGSGGQGGGLAGANGGLGSSLSRAANPNMPDPQGGERQHNRMVASAELQEKIENKLASAAEVKGLQEAVGSLRSDAVGVRMSLAASSFFPSGSAKLKKESLQTLDKVADILKSTKYRLLIEGHSDDQPLAPGSGFETNWELSSARASQVIRYLAKVHSIDPKRMAAMSYADQRPVVPNTTEANRAKNRRIEILILTGDGSQYEDF